MFHEAKVGTAFAGSKNKIRRWEIERGYGWVHKCDFAGMLFSSHRPSMQEYAFAFLSITLPVSAMGTPADGCCYGCVNESRKMLDSVTVPPDSMKSRLGPDPQWLGQPTPLARAFAKLVVQAPLPLGGKFPAG